MSQSSVPAEVRALVDRSNRVKTVSGSGTLTLDGSDGQRVVLDVAIALQLPDRARLRAWKMGQAVFDLTAVPTGVWLEAPDSPGDGRPSRGAVAGADAAGVAKAMGLLSGGFFADPAVQGRDVGDELTLSRGKANEAAVTCHVDRRTLTARRYELFDAVGAERFSLALDGYQPGADGTVWPWRATATSAAGTITVALDDVTVNGDLPAAAFVPPPRAGRLP